MLCSAWHKKLKREKEFEKARFEREDRKRQIKLANETRIQFLEEKVYVSPDALGRFNTCRFHSYMSSEIFDAIFNGRDVVKTSYFCLSSIKRRCINPQISCIHCGAYRKSVRKRKKKKGDK